MCCSLYSRIRLTMGLNGANYFYMTAKNLINVLGESTTSFTKHKNILITYYNKL